MQLSIETHNKKKTMKTILTALMALATIASFSQNSWEEACDLDGNCAVNTGDALITLQYMTSAASIADVNNDGSTNTGDLTIQLSVMGAVPTMRAAQGYPASQASHLDAGKKIVFNILQWSTMCETYSPWFSPGDSIPDTVRAQFSASEDVEIIAIGLISPLASGEQYNGWYWTNYSTLLRECNIIIDVIAPPGQHTVTVNALPWANTVEQLQNGEYQFTEINLSRPFTVE